LIGHDCSGYIRATLSKPITITQQEARRIAIAAQGLNGAWKLPAGKAGVACTIERLGTVQIDTIAVVERAHHHTLWTRRSDYRPSMLHELLAVDRRVFEYWATPAAAYVPMCDYRWYLPRMRWARESEYGRQRMQRHAADVKHVLARIRKEGALGSSDFAAPPGTKRGTWWDWKPAKHAMEILFHRGELMVSSRRNFERVYDLAERVLPADVDRREPTAAEARRFGALRYLTNHGLATARELRCAGHRSVPEEVVQELAAAGEIVPVRIEGIEADYWATPGVLSPVAQRKRDSTHCELRVHLLSPFDSFVHRGRLRRLFGFNYKIECYVPRAKRVHGYFCLPILFGDRLVGRLDPKADRATNRFIARRITLEPGVRDLDALLPALAAELHAFARFNGCETIEVEQITPARLRGGLRQALEEPKGSGAIRPSRSKTRITFPAPSPPEHR